MILKKVLHIITDLEQGGAEGVLYRLVKFDTSNQHIVISLMSEGHFGKLMQESGIKVYTLNNSRGSFGFSGLKLLNRIIKQEKPNLIQTWLYHADLIGSFVGALNGINVYWSIHLSNLSYNSTRLTTFILIRLLAALSYFIPKKIIFCSFSSMKNHFQIGYSKSKAIYIPLGFNHDNYYFKDDIRDQFRSFLKLKNHELVIGCVARWDLQKDHNNLFKAISFLKDKPYFGNLRICLAGYEMTNDNDSLLRLINLNNLNKEMFLFLGSFLEINQVYNGIDILVLSSKGESFPNVIFEGMLTSVPIISTDVGDVKALFGDLITIVPPSNSKNLSVELDKKILYMISNLNKREQDLNENVRHRLQPFTLKKMAHEYNNLWS